MFDSWSSMPCSVFLQVNLLIRLSKNCRSNLRGAGDQDSSIYQQLKFEMAVGNNFPVKGSMNSPHDTST